MLGKIEHKDIEVKSTVSITLEIDSVTVVLNAEDAEELYEELGNKMDEVGIR